MRLQPIDTLRVADTLRESGVPDEQARAHASVLAEALRARDNEIDTPIGSGLQQEFSPLKHAFSRLEAKIDTSFSKLEAELIVWIVSVGALQTALNAALLLNLLD
ncbi:MAG TPA: hypothetical protein VFT37_13655 [Telluria sp.]|nr:hypothetical protein [Telluria sp.]